MNKEIRIDLAGIIDKKGLHEALRQALSFPAHYGSNLDALHDMLTEFCAGTRIVIRGSEDIAPELDGYFEVMKNVFADAADETPGLEIILTGGPDGEQEEADERIAPVTEFNGGWSRRGLDRYVQRAWRTKNGEPV